MTAVLSWPAQGDYANETDFLTSDDGLARVRYSYDLPPIDAVALFTDGLQHLLLDYRTQTAHLPFFDRALARLHDPQSVGDHAASDALAQYLASEPVRARADDDPGPFRQGLPIPDRVDIGRAETGQA